MKQELKQQELKHISRVEEKVARLKLRLKKLNELYLHEFYKILKQIYDLRKSQISNYSIYSLSYETSINMTKGNISYLFGFEHFSKRSWELVRSEKIRPNAVLTIIKRGVAFRKPREQDLIVKKYIQGEISINDISTYSLNDLLGRIHKKEKDLPINEKKAFMVTVNSFRRAKINYKSYYKFLTKDQKKKLKHMGKMILKEIDEK